jgi:3-(3-hydroxy-phenyl)propionate hydroxylase
MDETTVAIAGGGPVGLTLALLLGNAGIATTVLEAEPTPSRDLRASTFHPPTLDMLDRLGIASELVANGLPCPTWQIRLHPSGARAVFDLAILKSETAHPYRLQCEQWKLSDALRTRIENHPHIQLLQSQRATALTQDEHGVTLTRDTAPPLRARYAVGTDGARSTIRQALGLPFEGSTYPETTLLATTTFPFENHLEGLSNVSYCWRESGGNFSLLKVPGRWRVSIYPREDIPLEDQMTPDSMNAELQSIVPRPVPYDIAESRPYRVHMRMVETYRIRRVALAGDAAHINAPAGGMGLNGGIHDAFELADSLTQILKNNAPDSLLTRYDARRRPIARDEILAQADRNRARMREANPEKRRETLAEMQAIASDPERCHAHLLRSSMISGLRRAASIK